MKLTLCFQNCREYKISLNSDKCAFVVFSKLILGFILSKERKIPNPKKVQAIMNMPIFTNPQQIQVFNGMAQFYRCFIKKIAFIMALITKLTKKTKPFIWTIECQEAWDQIKQKYMEALILIPPKLAIGVSCAHKCIIVGSRCNGGTKPNQ